MLEVRAISKRYPGVLAVDRVSFHIRPGEILGYVGPNGAGKSSTVKMIVGLLDPTDGQILFHGRSIHHDPAGFQSRIGYGPEEPTSIPTSPGTSTWSHRPASGHGGTDHRTQD